MNKNPPCQCLLLSILILIVACQPKKDPTQNTLVIYAAASLYDVLTEINQRFEQEHGIQVKLNSASSGTLARQIAQGATIDVFISANERWINHLENQGFVSSEKKKILAENELVFITPQESEVTIDSIHSQLDFSRLLVDGRLSIGNPAHVPAGIYAEQAFAYFGWEDQLADKLLPGKDVRSALMMVELGEAPLGIVYRTDGIRSSKVKIQQAVPSYSHQPIQYIAGLCSESANADLFYQMLTSPSALSVWKEHGFKVHTDD